MNCVYAVFEGETEKADSNTVAKKHTHLVEKVLKEKSEIIRNAVETGQTALINCHFDHSTGIVSIID